MIARIEDLRTLESFPEEFPDRWGNWHLKRATRELVFRDGRYWVDLDQMTRSASMLDWIAQVAGKTWATPEDLGNLVQALNDLLRPQANLCGLGRDHGFDPVAWLKARAKREQA